MSNTKPQLDTATVLWALGSPEGWTKGDFSDDVHLQADRVLRGYILRAVVTPRPDVDLQQLRSHMEASLTNVDRLLARAVAVDEHLLSYYTALTSGAAILDDDPDTIERVLSALSAECRFAKRLGPQ